MNVLLFILLFILLYYIARKIRINYLIKKEGELLRQKEIEKKLPKQIIVKKNYRKEKNNGRRKNTRTVSNRTNKKR